MSFRELRSFAETMRLLGYPHLISMESFRTPNVELVADCLDWLVKRYEPSVEVAYNIERESDRVTFFKQICEAALTKARVKLNIKKLYQADGHAVQEMLKLANVLLKAMRATQDAEEPDFAALQQMAAQKNVQDAKTVQQLSSDLTSDGSSLFFLVEAEMRDRGGRQHVLSRATEVGEFERRLRELLTTVAQEVEQLQQSITNLSADETNLEQKIEGRKTQLERAQKRYKSLMAVRPAYVEEYDKHESELQAQFVKYLEQYRNLEYLEYQLAKFNAREDAVLQEQQTALSVMRERLRKEELKTLRNGAAKRPSAGGARGGRRSYGADGDDGDDDGDDESSSDGDNAGPGSANVRNGAEEGSSVASSEEDDASTSDESDHAPPAARPQGARGVGGAQLGIAAVGRPPVSAAGGRAAMNIRTNDDEDDDDDDDDDDSSEETTSSDDDSTDETTTSGDDSSDDDDDASDESDI